ncbi:DUF3083 family protein [Paraglaciecola aquimarina]|uniref:DUF3083 family protein n=1 Tax=Paraglaciecola algarum TaxID=3050085 RepID=A0ABS9DD75_9ALTE|nr:DUF3083 family protein [Paraglaciecola sp. G1-23]MCF2949734.1 DUF3083 family protein [Paraglaciecola sp. G1-23]
MRRSTSILRKHRAGDKVYLPSDSRDNQYILAEFPLTDELVKSVAGSIDTNLKKPYQRFYQKLASSIFETTEKHGIERANLVANNKLVRVRYGSEQQVLHTEQQSFFFYCPSHNATFKGYFDGAVKARKIKLLFLATGENLRLNSAAFHEKVFGAVKEIASNLGLAADSVKVRDHQHITFDIFAQEKGLKSTITHSFREMADRYAKQGFNIGQDHTSLTYTVVSIPMMRRLLKGTNIDYDSEQPYQALYQKIEDAFKSAVEKNALKHAALLGISASPIVRYNNEDSVNLNGEIVGIGFDPTKEETFVTSMWEGDTLVDTIRFIFFANERDESNNNYGKFANQSIQAVKDFADEVNWKKDHDDIIVRIHQHIMRKV